MADFLYTKLNTGLAVIGERNPNAQSTAAGYFVRTGSRDETPDVLGVSHFLEHMMFKGTDRRSYEDINREFDELGAQYNAFTSEENTVYYGRVLPEFQPRLLDLLTDMMRPAIRVEDFTMEKNVILEEIARAEDNPLHLAYDGAREFYFDGHPLGNRVLGTVESITDLNRDRMYAYFERRYSPGNMVLALTGNFDWDATLEQVGKATAAWTPFDTPRDLTPLSAQSRIKTVRNDRLSRAHLIWMMPGVSAQDESRYVANVVAHAVGDDVGSRFYWALIDPGLADEASLSHDEEDGSGLFMAYVSCSAKQAQEVVNIVRNLLGEVSEKGLTPDEIERAKQKIASGQVLRSETPMGRLVPVGMNWQYCREYLTVDGTVDRLLAVDAEEVARFLATRPFDGQTVYALGPLDSLA